jgi:MFS family permease
MSKVETMGGNPKEQMFVFWGCFIALVTTAFAFIGRVFLAGTWQEQFGLDPAQVGRLIGIGIWPFAVSIIGFSLFIDSIGYRTAMILAFAGHMVWASLALAAFFVKDNETAFNMLYWGSLIVALANGAVEAFINPVVATMFDKAKTKWLNILHAGWPAGLVIAGIVTIYLDDMGWGYKIAMIAVPAVVYFLMLISCHLPVNERVSSGVSYREMLAEFGLLGAIVVAFLITLQLTDFYSNGGKTPLSSGQLSVFAGLGIAMVGAFGFYTNWAIGRPLMLVLILIMIPLATTEIGTDSAITGIMEGIAKNGPNPFHPGWILVYTSVIMMVLRFFAGPIVHVMSPLGLLAVSSMLAIAGLYSLSWAKDTMIFVMATLYGVGKTFFWPTMLGVVSEQCPKGGALTLNAISGIGMLAVGTLGTPYIGTLQVAEENHAIERSSLIEATLPKIFTDGKLNILEDAKIYEVIPYQKISEEKLAAAYGSLPDEEMRTTAAKRVAEVREASKQKALARMIRFPIIMLVGYIGLIAYFASRGGYRPVHLDSSGQSH